ncbi:hypothetical protein A0257_06680 [Hymenobacter psoromatis]|nr:hypothetical protein A0257_06680 [Hymenobacter psoromatis]
MQPILQDAKPEELPASPLLLKVGNEQAHQNADIKIVIFGQETNSWYESFHGDTDAILGYYDKFFNSGDYKRYGGQFWNGVARFISMLQERYPSKTIHLLWNNLVKIGKDAGRGFPSNIIHEVERRELDVIQEELSILQPTIALFFTGPNYDSIIAEVFHNPEFYPIMDNFSVRQLATLTIPNAGQAFRTYHPGYLWRNNINHYFQAIINKVTLD